MKAIDIRKVLEAITTAFPPKEGQRHNFTLGPDGRVCLTLMLGRMFPMMMSDDHDFEDVGAAVEEIKAIISQVAGAERQLQVMRGAIERELGRSEIGSGLTTEELEARCGVKPETRRQFFLALSEVMKRPDFNYDQGRMFITAKQP